MCKIQAGRGLICIFLFMAYNSNISDANGKFQVFTEYLHIFLDTRFLEMCLLCVINAIGVK